MLGRKRDCVLQTTSLPFSLLAQTPYQFTCVSWAGQSPLSQFTLHQTLELTLWDSTREYAEPFYCLTRCGVLETLLVLPWSTLLKRLSTLRVSALGIGLDTGADTHKPFHQDYAVFPVWSCPRALWLCAMPKALGGAFKGSSGLLQSSSIFTIVIIRITRDGTIFTGSPCVGAPCLLKCPSNDVFKNIACDFRNVTVKMRVHGSKVRGPHGEIEDMQLLLWKTLCGKGICEGYALETPNPRDRVVFLFPRSSFTRSWGGFP